jgi:hypothetical protein
MYWVVCFLVAAGFARAATEIRLPAKWADTQSYGSLVCHADSSLDDIEPLLQELDQLSAEIQETLETVSQPGTIDLYVFRTRQAYQDYLEHYFPGVPYRRALFITAHGQRMVFVQRGPELETDLRHECTHAILQPATIAMPLWLDEGLACYFEVPPADRGTDPRGAKVRQLVNKGEVKSLAELERCVDLAQMGGDEYRFAWAWVHFLLHDSFTARAELLQFVAAVHNGTATPPLSQRLARAVPRIQELFSAHFAAWADRRSQ